MNPTDLEQRALKLSLGGVVLMASFGIGLGLYLNIEAILLDGFFSLLSMGMTGLSLLTAYLIQRPVDAKFQFGYAHLEPLMNTVNGIVIMVVCVYAFFQGLAGITAGGHLIPFTTALVYAVPVTLFCALLCLYETWVAKQIDSELVRVDSREWLVDSLLTGTLCVGFLIGSELEGTRFAHWAPYVDPVLVTLLSAIAVVIPYRVLKRNLRQVLLVAPPEMARRFRSIVDRELKPYRVRTISTHVAKIGRRYDLEINVLVDEQSPLFDAGLEALDEVRNRLRDALELDPQQHWISIAFTQDRDWL